jgi:hypothetical protein
MGWFTWLAVIISFSLSIAFNLYMADAILRLRSDVQITRKRVYSIWRKTTGKQGKQHGDQDGDGEDEKDREKEQEEESSSSTKKEKKP